MREILQSYGRTMLTAFSGLSIFLLLFTQLRAPSGERGLYAVLAENLHRDETPVSDTSEKNTNQVMEQKRHTFHPRSDLAADGSSYPLTELFAESDGVTGGKVLAFEALNPDGSATDLLGSCLGDDGRSISFPGKGQYHLRATLRDGSGASYYKNFYFTIITAKAKNK